MISATVSGALGRPIAQLFEAFEVAVDAAIRGTQRVADLLLDPLRDEVHLDHHPGGLVVDAMEGDDAGVLLAVGVSPGDPLVGLLLGDLRIPLVA